MRSATGPGIRRWRIFLPREGAFAIAKKYHRLARGGQRGEILMPVVIEVSGSQCHGAFALFFHSETASFPMSIGTRKKHVDTAAPGRTLVVRVGDGQVGL